MLLINLETGACWTKGNGQEFITASAWACKAWLRHHCDSSKGVGPRWFHLCCSITIKLQFATRVHARWTPLHLSLLSWAVREAGTCQLQAAWSWAAASPYIVLSSDGWGWCPAALDGWSWAAGSPGTVEQWGDTNMALAALSPWAEGSPHAQLRWKEAECWYWRLALAMTISSQFSWAVGEMTIHPAGPSLWPEGLSHEQCDCTNLALAVQFI